MSLPFTGCVPEGQHSSNPAPATKERSVGGETRPRHPRGEGAACHKAGYVLAAKRWLQYVVRTARVKLPII
ncbi:MAG: hypothetical protein J5730_01620 [Bacteroidales bacterium]|nr:hypothetical protein [Bacteroidales bacterium]